jgi:BMFP domain-containing protein YqiC
MVLHLVDDGIRSEDDRAALAAAREMVAAARQRMQELADRLGGLKARLAHDGGGPGDAPSGDDQSGSGSGGS